MSNLRAVKQKLKGKKIDVDFVLKTLDDVDLDPIRTLALMAKGDVVGLGLMTKAEYERKPRLGMKENVEWRSGKEIAMEMIPPKVRATCLQELMAYIAGKQAAKQEKEEGDQHASVEFYLPDNGRGDTEKKMVIKVKKK